MTREIKFRAWDKKTRAFIYRLGHWDDNINMLNLSEDLASVSGWPNLILMQFTGLKDKNGTKIYEGDIVRVKPHKAIYPVAWDNGGYWGVQNGDRVYAFSGGTDISAKTSEVIGNIYENSELLK